MIGANWAIGRGSSGVVVRAAKGGGKHRAADQVERQEEIHPVIFYIFLQIFYKVGGVKKSIAICQNQIGVFNPLPTQGLGFTLFVGNFPMPRF